MKLENLFASYYVPLNDIKLYRKQIVCLYPILISNTSNQKFSWITCVYYLE